MRKSLLLTKTLFISSILLILSACGGGGETASSSAQSTTPAPKPTPVNVAPSVSVGEDQEIRVNTRVVLVGEASDSDGAIESYKWEKTSHVAGEEYIELQDTTKATAYFDTNFVITDTQEYEFTLTVTDDDGSTSSDTLKVTVLPVEHVDFKLPENIHRANLTALNDNTVLITGGCKSLGHDNKIVNSNCVNPSLSAFVINLEKEELTEIENVNYPKVHPISNHRSTLLPNGSVFFTNQIIGEEGNLIHYSEIYDSNSQQFTPTASMQYVRWHAMPVLLNEDTILAFSSFSDRGYTDTIESYSISTDTWNILDAKYPEQNVGSIISTHLPNERALLIGGSNTEKTRSNRSYIYEHVSQTVTEIENLRPPEANNGKDMGTGNNGGGDFRRIDLNDNTFCLLSHSNVAAFIDPTPIRFNTETNKFEDDISPCEQWWNVGGYSVDGETFTNGHALIGAAHIELKSDTVWITQQLGTEHEEKTYNEDCDCYNFVEPMTIRVIKH